jgi:hypothetical protein
MNQEFLQAAHDFAKRSRRVALGFTVMVDRKNCNTEDFQGEARETPYGRFRPRWLLIEASEGVILHDVRFGAASQFAGGGGLPASLYSVHDAAMLFKSPEDPAWDRFKFELGPGEAIEPHQNITLMMSAPTPRVVHAVFLGDEPAYRNWECIAPGMLTGVMMTGGGPAVEVDLGGGPVRIPIKPSDIPRLVEKIGKRVKFTLVTED